MYKKHGKTLSNIKALTHGKAHASVNNWKLVWKTMYWRSSVNDLSTENAQLLTKSPLV